MSPKDLAMLVLIIFHMITMGLMVMAARFVYKKTKLKNKFIMAMIFTIMLGITTDILKNASIIIFEIPEYGTTRLIFIRSVNLFMQFGLIINLRIWTSYFLKIKLMANFGS